MCFIVVFGTALLLLVLLLLFDLIQVLPLQLLNQQLLHSLLNNRLQAPNNLLGLEHINQKLNRFSLHLHHFPEAFNQESFDLEQLQLGLL